MATEKVREVVEERAASFDPNSIDVPDPQGEPELDRFYSTLRDSVEMVTRGYTNLLMLDAPGGLGKTHNVKSVLRETHTGKWLRQAGFTTPVELYKTLWKARHDDTILFLDDMSGVTKNDKALNMLKAATDTEGAENWVEYRSSRSIDHPEREGQSLPTTFCFRGSIIMSFNETPDNRHFDAFKDRGTFYQFDLSHDERIDLIRQMAKIEGFSDLSIAEQQECAEWVNTVTDPSIEVSIRTFEHVCQMRAFGNDRGRDWERMALDVFDLDYERYLIIKLRERTDLKVERQVEIFEERTGRSRSHYYDVLSEIRSQRMGH